MIKAYVSSFCRMPKLPLREMAAEGHGWQVPRCVQPQGKMLIHADLKKADKGSTERAALARDLAMRASSGASATSHRPHRGMGPPSRGGGRLWASSVCQPRRPSPASACRSIPALRYSPKYSPPSLPNERARPFGPAPAPPRWIPTWVRVTVFEIPKTIFQL